MDLKEASKRLSEDLAAALGAEDRERRAFVLAPESVDGLAAAAMLLRFLRRHGFRISVRFFGAAPYQPSQSPQAALSINLGGPEEACRGCVTVRSPHGSHGLPLPLSAIVAGALEGLGERHGWAYKLAVIGSISAGADMGDGRSFVSELGWLVEGAERHGVLGSTSSIELPYGNILPLYESLNISMDPYLKGLTGNEEACISILKDLGILSVGNERYTTLKDLTGEQASALVEGLEKYAQGSLKRTVYYDPAADESSVLWSYRDTALLFELMILRGMYDRAFRVLTELESAGSVEDLWRGSLEHMKQLIKSFNGIVGNRERMLEEAGALRVVATGLAGVRETAQFLKWIGIQRGYSGRTIIGETNSGSDEVLIAFLKEGKEAQLFDAAKKYGGKAIVHYPFILFYVNVIKAGLLYNDLIRIAGVP